METSVREVPQVFFFNSYYDSRCHEKFDGRTHGFHEPSGGIRVIAYFMGLRGDGWVRCFPPDKASASPPLSERNFYTGRCSEALYLSLNNGFPQVSKEISGRSIRISFRASPLQAMCCLLLPSRSVFSKK